VKGYGHAIDGLSSMGSYIGVQFNSNRRSVGCLDRFAINFSHDDRQR
jgi:hypothetical protein